MIFLCLRRVHRAKCFLRRPAPLVVAQSVPFRAIVDPYPSPVDRERAGPFFFFCEARAASFSFPCGYLLTEEARLSPMGGCLLLEDGSSGVRISVHIDSMGGASVEGRGKYASISMYAGERRGMLIDRLAFDRARPTRRFMRYRACWMIERFACMKTTDPNTILHCLNATLRVSGLAVCASSAGDSPAPAPIFWVDLHLYFALFVACHAVD